MNSPENLLVVEPSSLDDLFGCWLSILDQSIDQNIVRFHYTQVFSWPVIPHEITLVEQSLGVPSNLIFSPKQLPELLWLTQKVFLLHFSTLQVFKVNILLFWKKSKKYLVSLLRIEYVLRVIAYPNFHLLVRPTSNRITCLAVDCLNLDVFTMPQVITLWYW